MQMHPLFGHALARRQISRAVSSRTLPQLLLLVGPQGVGKQRLALWVAQLLACQNRSEEPCGTCGPCRMVLGLAHPDLHWMIPVPRPKASEPEKQVEELEEAVAHAITERREQPLYGPVEGMASHFVATAHLIQRKAALTPVMGRHKVFIVAEAERLVPQESAPEAANALLKLLEEPPADTYFILTVSDLAALLPTIRSRGVPVRLGRLRDDEVRDFLIARTTPAPSGAALDERVARAEGSIGLAAIDGQESPKARQAAHELLAAILGGAASRAERALRQGPFAARGDFTSMLDALSETLSDATRASVGQPPRRSLPPALTQPRPAEALLRASRKVTAAREAAQGNVNPQLLLAVLADDLAGDL
jgi:DNA polymerase-3 subunit delta'